jgi:hypothetical protein
VADGDLADLQSAYKSVLADLESKGISVDKVWVKPLTVKFTNPDSLFEFMAKYDTYLKKDGIAATNYKPWIKSSMSIPPLAGGVGRMRALSKSVYALNYYHYMEMNNVISVFKDRVLTSKFQPIVLIVFGLGGGTGSGMVFDFARHLRAKLGSAVPIVGLAILPSSADDLLARGPAPYTALLEAELLFNRRLNEAVTKKYGEPYRNPFTTLMFIPLDPVYNTKSNLVNAKKELDDALVDIQHILMNFDLADLLSRIGTNNDFGPNWVHNVAYLRIRYPVDDYVRYLHEYLKLLENVGGFVEAKREALLKINEALSHRLAEVKELYRRHLISVNSYRPETFETEVEGVLSRAGKFEAELMKQVKGLEDFASNYNERWSKVMQAMTFADESAESSVVHIINHWRDMISKLGRTHDQFASELQANISELEDNITASKFLTSSQIKQIRSYVSFAQMIGSGLETLNLYISAKLLTDETAALYGKDQSREGRSVQTKAERELLPLFKAAGYIMTRPETEVKVSDQYIPGIRVVKGNVESAYKDSYAEAESTERLLAQKEADVGRLNKDLEKVKVDVSGKKKLMKKNIETLESDVASLRTKLQLQRAETATLQSELEKMASLEKDLELTSPYRKVLNSIVTKTTELNAMMSSITSTGSYYERVVELSDAEQIKIMSKILKEEEEALRGEGILKEILDRERLRNIVKSYMRIFSVSNYAGLADSYRSDLIWATVGIPTGLWDQDLQGALSSTLNVYSSVEASKSISIRQIQQIDPWTITFLIILAKAKAEQIEKFGSMKGDTGSVPVTERTLFRSFLLEHGIQNVEELRAQLEKAASSRSR